MNENNNIPQGLITNDKINLENKVSENAPKNKVKINFSNKGNMKIILGVVIIAIVAIVLYTLMSEKKLGIFNKNKAPEPVEIVALDLDTRWGKEYSVVAQNVYEQQEVDKIDVSFINLDFTDEPEMIIKYLDAAEKEYMVIYSIDNVTGTPKNTKTFSNATLLMMFSLKDGDCEWYLNIASGKKYGTYTRLSKIISGTVKSTDEDVRTDKALSEFNERYIKSEYKIVYYQVNKDKFEENFRTIYGRFNEYDDKIFEEKKNLESGNAENVIKRHDEGEFFDTGGYYLSFGQYDYVPVKNAEGVEVTSKYNQYVITINRDGTFSMNGEIHKYEVHGEYITLDNAESIRVIDNNTIIYDVEGGIKFTAHDPYVKPEEPAAPEEKDKEVE